MILKIGQPHQLDLSPSENITYRESEALSGPVRGRWLPIRERPLPRGVVAISFERNLLYVRRSHLKLVAPHIRGMLRKHGFPCTKESDVYDVKFQVLFGYETSRVLYHIVPESHRTVIETNDRDSLYLKVITLAASLDNHKPIVVLPEGSCYKTVVHAISF